MKLWIDAQLSPAIASWISSNFDFEAIAIRDIGLREAEDLAIFMAAKREDAFVVTKDKDFVILLDRFGPPPKIIWLTCGNTSNFRLRSILQESLLQALELLDGGETLVEINSSD
ncbi:MAG: DUF5615 family PIN-like protein [Acidobacteria bacterium]|nr:DUF5615 family PIN-like protein [Acidobacteriota bacterium]